jgi:hypothetical protein
MKSLLALTLACFTFTLPSCIDLAALDGGGGGGYGGGGYGGGGYGGGGYSAPYRPQPNYGGGYNQHPNYDHDHNDHDSGRNNNYFGGPQAWYKSGYALGKRDHREHKSCNYHRYSDQYDRKTESEFAHGYEEGFH